MISLCFERVSERDESAPCSRFDRAEPWNEMGAGQRDEPEGAADDWGERDRGRRPTRGGGRPQRAGQGPLPHHRGG
ncbi:protein of unknown function [Methylorubrum extorquens]|uniref:Uncharacterized protein n=1 Tax=Methylorubrum extorquens TaxID=408 RepID=A0A2N9AJ02_METEX|nr:protein of unknown function [Methylorubrum extorquens]